MKRIIILLGIILQLSLSCTAIPIRNSVRDSILTKEDSIFVFNEQELLDAVKKAVKKRREKLETDQLKQLVMKEKLKLLEQQILMKSIRLSGQPFYTSEPVSDRSVLVGKDMDGHNIYRTSPQPGPVYISPGGARTTVIPMPINRKTRTVVVPAPIVINKKKGQTVPDTVDSVDVLRLTDLLTRQNELLESMSIQLASLQNKVHEIETSSKLSAVPIVSIPNSKQSNLSNNTETYRDTAIVYRTDTTTLAPYFQRQVYFRQSSAQLDLKARSILDAAINLIKSAPNSILVLTGYASPEGNRQFNLNLSKKRTMAVYNYMIEHGISKTRLKVSHGHIDRSSGIYAIARRVSIMVESE